MSKRESVSEYIFLPFEMYDRPEWLPQKNRSMRSIQLSSNSNEFSMTYNSHRDKSFQWFVKVDAS